MEVVMKDILSTLVSEGSFQTLLSMLERADLACTLAEGGQFTLFASNDEAFKRMNIDQLAADRDKLLSMLTYHIVDGKYTSAEISRADHLLTRSGKSLTVHLEEGKQVVDNARY